MEKEKNNELDLRRFIATVKDCRWLYVGSFTSIMVLTILYLIISMPRYSIHSTLLIEEPANDLPQTANGMSSLMRAFSIGSFGTASVENEKLLLSSYDLKLSITRELGLNRTYTYRKGMKKFMLSPQESPVTVNARRELFDTLSFSLKMDITVLNRHADISLTKGHFLNTTIAECTNVALPYTLQTPVGTFEIEATGVKGMDGQKIQVLISGYEECARNLDETIDIQIAGRVSDAIGLYIVYPNKRLGIDILNCLMSEYNKKRLHRKWSNADLEIGFYDDRISSLFNELSTTEKQIENFKKSNDLISIENEAPILVENEFISRQELAALITKRNYYESIRSQLNDSLSAYTPLPVVAGFELEEGDGSLISVYNDDILRRRELSRSAKGENRTLKALDSRLASLRTDIIAGMDEQIRATDLVIASHKKNGGAIESRIRQLPEHEREYITLLRDQKLKNELYTFLLERRENALLSRQSPATLGYIFQDAYYEGPDTRKRIILAIAVILSLVIPTIWVFVKMSHGIIKRLSDLNFDNLEKDSVGIDAKAGNISSLRSLLRRHKSRCIILSLDSTPTDLPALLAQSFLAIGTTVETLTISSADMLHDSRLTDRINGLIDSGCYVLLRLPADIDLATLHDFSLVGQAQLLVAFMSGTMRRNILRRCLAPVPDSLPVTIALCH